MLLPCKNGLGGLVKRELAGDFVQDWVGNEGIVLKDLAG